MARQQFKVAVAPVLLSVAKFANAAAVSWHKPSVDDAAILKEKSFFGVGMCLRNDNGFFSFFLSVPRQLGSRVSHHKRKLKYKG